MADKKRPWPGKLFINASINISAIREVAEYVHDTFARNRKIRTGRCLEWVGILRAC